MIKVPETLNLKSAKEWLKNKKVKLQIPKPKTKKQKASLKNLSKTATLSLLSIPLVIDWRITLFIIGNYFCFLWYRSVCFRIDLKNKLQKEKLEKYENSQGILKRMKNLKQFSTKTPS